MWRLPRLSPVRAAAAVRWQRLFATAGTRSGESVDAAATAGTVPGSAGDHDRLQSRSPRGILRSRTEEAGGPPPPSAPRRRRRAWTSEEDRALRRAVEEAGGDSATPHWAAIASAVAKVGGGGARSGAACRQRWVQSLRDGRRRGRFSPAEDRALLALVREMSPRATGAEVSSTPPLSSSLSSSSSSSHSSTPRATRDYVGLARALNTGRPAPTVRERLLLRLDPSIRWTRFSGREDETLRATVAVHGRDWVRAASALPGRTRQQCMHRWFALMPGKTAGGWTVEEDARLLAVHGRLVADRGVEHVTFGQVAELMGSRNRKQCYARFQRLQARQRRKDREGPA